ncbi:hypothetical protein [Haloarcula marina]|uniref:hypothetical protein n=1 Tax=Haloarcula marina TaxID=2961574 RepID=UPI0020B77BA7|nr:hypothetical protein [Halomicroarcula marina]
MVGFVALGIATVTAYLNPATGYELSIYAGTPTTFWIGVVFAFLLSILVVFLVRSHKYRVLGMLLGGLAMTTIVSLPVIRGYYYFGEGDALDHLGIARDMSAGFLPLTESRYPVIHSLATVVHYVSGLPLHHVTLVVLVSFVVCFFVFVPLVVRELTGNVWTAYVGLFSAFLLLPINHQSPPLNFHPTSQAIMYTPVFLFAFFLLYKYRNLRHSTMFLLLSPVFVLLHPQQAANLVAFFGVVAAIQIGYDLLSGHRLERVHKWVAPEVAIYATVFWLWARSLPVFERNLESVLTTLSGQTNFAESTAQRGSSLADVGGSIPEVFAKLFLVSLVYVVLTGLLSMLVLRSLRRAKSHTSLEKVAPDGGADQILLLSIFGGLVPVTMIFLVYLVGGISIQNFRHLAMLMVFATILGSIMIGRTMQYVRGRWSGTAARRSIALVFVVLAALSLIVVFPSPYIYYPSGHVTETQMDGYETTFEHQADSIAFGFVRSDVARYGAAIQGTNRSEDIYYQKLHHGLPDRFCNQSLRRYYDEQTYIPVTEADRVRDPVLWKGFRFDHEDFEYIQSEPGIDRVQSTGGYTLYLVNPKPGSGSDEAQGTDPESPQAIAAECAGQAEGSDSAPS